jgi:toxin secretion/phage lysis holin
VREFLDLGRADWATAAPWIAVLVWLIVVDIAMGLICAFGAKQLNSTASWKGMSKKAACLLIVSTACALDPFVPNVPVATLTAMFYIGTEVLSITENAGRLGLPVPQALIDACSKLKGPKAPSDPGA